MLPGRALGAERWVAPAGRPWRSGPLGRWRAGRSSRCWSWLPSRVGCGLAGRRRCSTVGAPGIRSILGVPCAGHPRHGLSSWPIWRRQRTAALEQVLRGARSDAVGGGRDQVNNLHSTDWALLGTAQAVTIAPSASMTTRWVGLAGSRCAGAGFAAAAATRLDIDTPTICCGGRSS
jgi:hypothetical protein